MKFVFVVLVASYILVSANCCHVKEVRTFPCEIKAKCSFEEDIVWSTDGDTCYPFINPCQFGNENCNRKRDNLPELKVVCKRQCQAKCPQICPTIELPVCGIYRGEKTEFSNQCKMDVHICTTGEFYLLDHTGTC